jgi:hypothetical protein
MSCMYFHRPHRDPDDSTESSDSITYWRKLLGSGRVVMIGDQANEARHLIVKTHESVAWCSVTRDGRGTVGAPLVWLPALPLTWGREVPLQVAAHESP